MRSKQFTVSHMERREVMSPQAVAIAAAAIVIVAGTVVLKRKSR